MVLDRKFEKYLGGYWIINSVYCLIVWRKSSYLATMLSIQTTEWLVIKSI